MDTDTKDEIAELRTIIDGLRDDMAQMSQRLDDWTRQPAQSGLFPAFNDLEKIEVQLWHNPPERRKSANQSAWVLTFDHWAVGSRNKSTVPLMSPQRLYRALMERGNATPESILTAIRDIADDDGILCGMVRRRVAKRYGDSEPRQVAVVSGHDGPATRQIVVMLNDDRLLISDIRDASGDKPNKPIWYGQWQQERHTIAPAEHQGRPPYGYRVGLDGKLVPVPAEQEIIERVIGLAQIGMSHREIARQVDIGKTTVSKLVAVKSALFNGIR